MPAPEIFTPSDRKVIRLAELRDTRRFRPVSLRPALCERHKLVVIHYLASPDDDLPPPAAPALPAPRYAA